MFYRKDQDKIEEYFLTLFRNYNRKMSLNSFPTQFPAQIYTQNFKM